MWLLLHSGVGPVILCCWYRPPCPGEVQSIKNFEQEWREAADMGIATLIVGDLNLHHISWLHYSSHTSVEGSLMHKVCLSHGLRQCVREPTREKHLLDLAITDLEANVISSSVLPCLADHALLHIEVRLGLPIAIPLPGTSGYTKRPSGRIYALIWPAKIGHGSTR